MREVGLVLFGDEIFQAHVGLERFILEKALVLVEQASYGFAEGIGDRQLATMPPATAPVASG